MTWKEEFSKRVIPGNGKGDWSSSSTAAFWADLPCLVKQYFVSCILYFYTLYFGICIFPFVVLYLCNCKGEWIFSCGTAAFGAALACLVQHFQPDPAPCTLLFFSTFYFTFKNFSSTFHFHFLQLLQQLFQPHPAPCTLFLFFSTFLCHKNFLFACHFISITFPDIHHNCFKFTFFITCMPPFWHFIEQMYIWAHKYDDLRVLSQHFSCYICF